MIWEVLLHEDFASEYVELPQAVQDHLSAKMALLETHGPQLSRPHADRLEGSDYNNMKELRFAADKGVWRVAFAFDTERQAVVLVAGNKRGANQKRFYEALIQTADQRFTDWLNA